MEKGMTLQMTYRYRHGTNRGKTVQSSSPLVPQLPPRAGRHPR